MPTIYDTVLYRGAPFAQTHPNRLATLATLFGLEPAPVTKCRVLELGCTDGGNLIPMAMGLPESEFVGVDLAERPVSMGQAMIRELGLKNLTLRAADVMQVGPAWGKFDYIITHGLYSWVPAPVRQHLLKVSKENLAPRGVAYISYNAYPGGHLRKMIREMILFHVRGIEEPQERIQQAQALLAFLASSAPSKVDEYRAFVKSELDNMLERDPNVLFHDEMAETYEPVFFHQFMEDARRHGLQFLSEANVFEIQDSAFAEPVAAALEAVSGGDRIAREQYRDFLKCRKFRQTVLCHADVKINAEPAAVAVRNMYAASPAKLVSNGPGGITEFQGPHGSAMKTAHPVANAAIMRLVNAWPRALHFDELLESVGAEHVDALTEIVYTTFSAGLVELHVWRAPFTVTAGVRPVASPLARIQARSGSTVTTLRHSSVDAEGDLTRKLITLLDGTRDREALKRELAPLRGGVTDETLAREVEASLAKAGLLALLVE